MLITKKIDPTTWVELRHSKIGESKMLILFEKMLAPNDVNPDTVSK
jgi:hypothetical protein